MSQKDELPHPKGDVHLIRPMNASDIPKIVSRYAFPWSTPEQTQQIWDTYSHEQQDGIRTVAIVEKNTEILGYGSLLRKSECPNFASANIPEINAVWIDENHRRQGLGKALIKWIEALAIQEGYSQIGIGVGLYRDYDPECYLNSLSDSAKASGLCDRKRGSIELNTTPFPIAQPRELSLLSQSRIKVALRVYGPAQKLYFQLGYIPDGNGITYKGQPTVPGQAYPLDDDLILWLIKALTHF